MSEMVKRVARAMCARGCNPGLTENGREPCSRCDASDEPDYLADARAVIEAMCEPTPDMVLEGESAASLYLCKPQNDEGVPHVWREMIKAALR